MLYLGDNIEMMKDIEDNTIDLTVTSPPYDNLRSYGDVKPFTFEDFQALATCLWRVTKIGGVVVWVVGDATTDGSETGSSFRQALYFKEVGFKLHDTMIYQKSGMSYPDSTRYHQIFEYVFILSKNRVKTFNPIKDRENKYQGTIGGNKRGGLCKRGKNGMRFNIWRYSNGRDNSTKDRAAFKHPAVFPEKLAGDHIISWSNQNDVVLDPFMGSGTTGKMAKKLNREFIGIEINPEYFEIAKKRIDDTT